MLSYGKTVTGKVRKNNQDYIYHSDSKVGSLPNLYIVADGMGGHAAGEVASKCAVESFTSYFKEKAIDLKDDRNIKKTLEEAVEFSNNKIYEKSIADLALEGMGTTFLCAFISNEKLYAANVGDSRLYKINTNKIEQITTDHSYVMDLVNLGEITPEEAETHPCKNVLTRALGTTKTLKVDTHIIDIQENDLFLLCSDGLTNMIDNDNIAKITNKNVPLKDMCDNMIHLANKNGGIDNISIILLSAN